MKKPLVFALSVFLAGSVLSPFAVADEASGNDLLAGSEWGPAESGEPFIRFEAEGRVAGSGGCNRIFGSYTASDENMISIGPLASTKMMCPQDVMDGEAAFIASLESASGFSRETGKLTLFDKDGAEIIVLRHRDWD